MNFWTGTLAVVTAIVLANLVIKQINKIVNPLVKASSKVAWQFRGLRLLLSKIPEGQLLHVADHDIFEIGQAMLLDGASTKDINALMLQLWFEKLVTQIPTRIVSYTTFVSYPGYTAKE